MLKSEMIELLVDRHARLHGRPVAWAYKMLAKVPAYQLTAWLELATTTEGTPEHAAAKIAVRAAGDRRLNVSSGRQR
jgi:hypothetical protein